MYSRKQFALAVLCAAMVTGGLTPAKAQAISHEEAHRKAEALLKQMTLD